MDIVRVPAVHNFLENSASLYADKIAFVHDEQRVSYTQVNQMANRLARWLIDQGVNEGDRVVLLLENSIEYVASYYGVLKARGVAVPLNSETRADSLAAVLEELRPKVVIAGAKCEKLLQEVQPERFKIRLMLIKSPKQPWSSSSYQVAAWDDVAASGQSSNPGLLIDPTSLASIIYTSGSTGKPKGVMLSHRNIVANTDSIVQYLKLTENDIQMVVLPFFYVMGKSLLNTHFAVGGRVVINNNFAYPASVIKQMADEQVTGFSGVPATYAYMLHRSPLHSFRDRLNSLRYCTQAGGHMSRQIKEKLLETLPAHTKLIVMYGATEAAARLTYVEPERLAAKIESIGRPIPGVTMKVLDEKGKELAVGEIGELVASGANIMQGYWMDPAATARALDQHGYHTGDLGYRDDDGYLYVIGRKDDLLKVGGHRVDPQEVEDALMATGLLLEVAVLGIDDPLLGKKLVAVAVPLGEEATESRILAHCLDKLPRHKLPAEIRFVHALPKYASSKIDRPGCLALFKAGSDENIKRGPTMTSIGSFSGAVLKLDAERETERICSKIKELMLTQVKRRGLVVGLSGGIDSSVTAALAARALGRDRVLGLEMPERHSAEETLMLSGLLAKSLGVQTVKEDISGILESVGFYRRYDEAVRMVVPEYQQGWKSKIVISGLTDGSGGFNSFYIVAQGPDGSMSRKRLPFKPYLEIVAATNFKQRIRKMLEYYHADRLHFAVAGTPNRLEYDQGFFVKLGDGAADIKPIAHLYKTQVYQLAEYLGVPEEIRKRKPTTDTYSLAQGQDEFFFALPYDKMDLCLYARNNAVPAPVVADSLGIEPDQVEMVFRDIDAKRTTTRYLHLPPLLVDDVAWDSGE